MNISQCTVYLALVGVLLVCSPCPCVRVSSPTAVAAQVLSEHNEWGEPDADAATPHFHQECTVRPKAQRPSGDCRQRGQHQLRAGNGDRPHLQASPRGLQAAGGRVPAAGGCGHLQEARQSLGAEAVPCSCCTVIHALVDQTNHDLCIACFENYLTYSMLLL